ncbi:hypothetical protein [Xanthomonas campestris]|uniref:hypothetical protein n=1 Tax=Xanthomonas campestris TaxID=339 RepID=UPI002368CD88|nr:hypothetical protein [Xanthomonas campestris]WDI91945.1 hypothetical protein JH280_11405 [Xanthomonas campestris]
MDEIEKRARELADRVLNIGLIYEGGGEIDGALSRVEKAAQELLAALSAAPRGVPLALPVAAREALPFIAYAYSQGVAGAEEAGRAIKSALAAKPEQP